MKDIFPIEGASVIVSDDMCDVTSKNDSNKVEKFILATPHFVALIK
mgnify:CR=1